MTTLAKEAIYPTKLNDAGIQETANEKTQRNNTNAQALQNEIVWFNQVLETRLKLYFENDCEYSSIEAVEPPDVSQDTSAYAKLVNELGMTHHERIVLILTLIPHIQPQILNLLLIKDSVIGKPYVEFGGWRGTTHSGFLPTGETAVFIISGTDLSKRLEVFRLFSSDHFFSQLGILDIQMGHFHEAYLTAPLVISREYFLRLTIGHIEKPDFSMNFPAKLLETKMDWEDLVLPQKIKEDVEHLHTWMAHQQHIMHHMGLEKSISPGYRALFFGPPGTGKTLTASLLGKAVNMDVYRIELSSIVSKYIGETEKNLESIFQLAQNRRWVLFFDEADALFGKRSETQSSNDRHANQEVAYLLQRIEEFPGVVILATNLKANIDEAFLRRFQSVIYFPVPDVQHRLKLWQNALRECHELCDSIDLLCLAKNYEMAGGSIVNVIRFAAIHSLRQNRTVLTQRDLLAGIQKEQRKQGRLT